MNLPLQIGMDICWTGAWTNTFYSGIVVGIGFDEYYSNLVDPPVCMVCCSKRDKVVMLFDKHEIQTANRILTREEMLTHSSKHIRKVGKYWGGINYMNSYKSGSVLEQK